MVLGFVVYARVLDEVTVYEIAVRAQYQGRGLGQALLCSALREMRRVGVVRCLLEVRESNQPARRLYQRNGFSIDGVRASSIIRLRGWARGRSVNVRATMRIEQ